MIVMREKPQRSSKRERPKTRRSLMRRRRSFTPSKIVKMKTQEEVRKQTFYSWE